MPHKQSIHCSSALTIMAQDPHPLTRRQSLKLILQGSAGAAALGITDTTFAESPTNGQGRFDLGLPGSAQTLSTRPRPGGHNGWF